MKSNLLVFKFHGIVLYYTSLLLYGFEDMYDKACVDLLLLEPSGSKWEEHGHFAKVWEV
jgi:hypothetical protein